MQKNALPLSGDERAKAYQAIAQYVHDDYRHGPDRRPHILVRHEPAPGLDAARRMVSSWPRR